MNDHDYYRYDDYLDEDDYIMQVARVPAPRSPSARPVSKGDRHQEKAYLN